MSDRSYVEVRFGPVKGALATVLAEMTEVREDQEAAPELKERETALVEDLRGCNGISSDGGSYFVAEDEQVSGGVCGWSGMLELMRELGIAYDASDQPCLGAWDASEVRWRPGMPEERGLLRADMAGETALLASEWVRLVAEHGEDLAALKEEVEQALGLDIEPLQPAVAEWAAA